MTEIVTAIAAFAGAEAATAGTVAAATTVEAASVAAASTAFGTGAASLTSLSSGLSLASAGLQLFSGITSAFSMLSQGSAQAEALKLQSKDDLLEARQEEIRGKQETNQIMDNMIQTVASQRLAFATNGVDINFGTPKNVEQDTKHIANLQLGIARDDIAARALARRRQSAARMFERANVLSSSRMGAFGSLVEGGMGAYASLEEQRLRRLERG